MLWKINKSHESGKYSHLSHADAGHVVVDRHVHICMGGIFQVFRSGPPALVFHGERVCGQRLPDYNGKHRDVGGVLDFPERVLSDQLEIPDLGRDYWENAPLGVVSWTVFARTWLEQENDLPCGIFRNLLDDPSDHSVFSGFESEKIFGESNLIDIDLGKFDDSQYPKIRP